MSKIRLHRIHQNLWTASDLSVSFYRLKLKIELSDTSATANVRLTGVRFTCTVGEE